MTQPKRALEPTNLYHKVSEWYDKKRSREIDAARKNLELFLAELDKCKNSMELRAGYIHTEGKGVLAIDESGGGRGLQATRLYLFVDDSTKTVHLITIGNKKEQPKDIQICHQFVKQLREKKEAQDHGKTDLK